MKNSSYKPSLSPRKTFWKCGTCSRAMYHLLNHEFNNIKPEEEVASDLLAGGIALKGHQCGMLWGGALAVGTEAYHCYGDKNVAIAAAISASKYLVESFYRRAGAVNCRDIVKVSWEKKAHFILFTLKTIAQGFIFSPCFRFIAKWTPEAAQAASEGLSENLAQHQSCLSCATEVLKKMGATDEEAITAAGLAGGIGLSGNGCGALSAVIWYKMLCWRRSNPGKTPSMTNNREVKNILNVFYAQTGSEMVCHKICGRKFGTIDEHSEFIKNGGCRNLLEALAKC